MSAMTHRHRKQREARYLASHKLSSPKPKKETVKPVEEEKVIEPEQEIIPSFDYNKSDINRMPLANLKTVASEIGIDDVDEKTGGELKKLIIEKLGL